ncbi:Chromosome transmission fidelity protein 18 like protein [Dufourea novaeangliae]|uniref:Chromosome transmission fidelity protein 18 like protein n=1 Tax=Dufourea novaeangliae TaxID=178035 RepID=A0A154P8V7_DUFNO|nr:Chromosome transmission fidelity protein 18 like protein [Dufourea novaeangliae]
MDSEYPDPDEEFDLEHEADYELLRELEEHERKKSEKHQEIQNLHEKPKEKHELKSPASNLHKELNTPIHNVYKELNTPISNVHKELNAPTCSKDDDFSIPSTSKDNGHIDNSQVDGTKKRNYDELFGDISDIVDLNDFVDTYERKEKKPRWDHPQDVIKAVLDAREKFRDHSAGSVNRKHFEEKKNTISLRVPRWNFVAVTRPHDAQRIYIRMKNDTEPRVKSNANTLFSLLSVPYSQLKAEAEAIMVQNAKRASCENLDSSTRHFIPNDELWVDKYRPRSYIELLSDESVNRHLLHWLKLWDKVVFNRNYIQNKKKAQYSMFKNRRFMKNVEKDFEEVDSKGFPTQRIVLLTGPPGLGKTTLAHLAAKHAGYNVVEVNASDERSPDAFRQVLLASTQMKAVMGNDPRPNCLVLDEIDGAPVASIELLLKFVQGKLVQKGKKDKEKSNKRSTTCQRPVICICNEPYTPSLRALRTTALIISVPAVSPMRLADRLMEISRKEHLKVNPDALLKLAEISGCDVRSCLGALQYMGGAKLGDNMTFALKDNSIGNHLRSALEESEKLAQGIFHNYPEIHTEKLVYIALCLQWFQFFDEVLSLIATRQVWSVMPYTNYAFVTWHLYFAKTNNMNQKQARSMGVLTTIHKSSGRDSTVLAVDIAPFLPDLLSPQLRTVSGHLHSAKERDDLVRLVNVLVEFGLTFTQEKCLDGTYDYKLDPNIFEIGIFPDCKQRRTLAYTVKQIIVQELEAERLRRVLKPIQSNKSSTEKEDDNIVKNNGMTRPTESETNANKQNSKPKLPNPTKQSKQIGMETKEMVYKDFFGRVITLTQDKQQKSHKEFNSSRDLLTKHGVWYKYKEGFSNAVRRNIIMEELL